MAQTFFRDTAAIRALNILKVFQRHAMWMDVLGCFVEGFRGRCFTEEIGGLGNDRRYSHRSAVVPHQGGWRLFGCLP